MKGLTKVFPFFIVLAACIHYGMARNAQYDMEAREQEKLARQQEKQRKKFSEAASPARAAKRFAAGLKQATVDSTAGLISDTAESTREEAPIVGTLEGARKGTEKILDSTVKGVAKVATLGYGDVQHYEVEEPKANTDEPTKIKIKI